MGLFWHQRSLARGEFARAVQFRTSARDQPQAARYAESAQIGK
jgi:hypothetical protein